FVDNRETHLYAAYGGFFCLTTRGREQLRGIERADSVTLDPHKGLFLPYGTGALVVRDLKKLRAAHAVTASYLPAPQEDPDAWDFADLGPELSRDFRGLRVWLPLKLHGAKVFREALDEKLDLTRQLVEEVRSLPTVRIVSEPVLSLFSFRFEPADRPEASWDAFNRKVMSGVNQRQRVLLTGVTVEDPATQRPIFVIRACVLSFRTHADRIQMAAEDLRAALAEVQQTGGGEAR
ncbi:MAG TPA: pyridoxal-dependent decarboxylase, partial [Myxococcota bacterium]|nr:pyridoxal-dependent decarboxylase [Myxococcota bacterium]